MFVSPNHTATSSANHIKGLEANILRQSKTIRTLRRAGHLTTDAERHLKAMHSVLALLAAAEQLHSQPSDGIPVSAENN